MTTINFNKWFDKNNFTISNFFRLLCRGENTVNRLFLNNGKETFEATFEFEYVLSHIENIDDISISTQHSIGIIYNHRLNLHKFESYTEFL